MKGSIAKYMGPRLAGDTDAARISKIARDLARAKKNAGERVTNAVFAGTDAYFKMACELIGLKPTAAQASKWRRKCGAAYTAWTTKRNAEKAAA